MQLVDFHTHHNIRNKLLIPNLHHHHNTRSRHLLKIVRRFKKSYQSEKVLFHHVKKRNIVR